MGKSFRIIGVIAAIGITMMLSYLLGTTQAETITEIQTVTEIKEVIPAGYIQVGDSIIDMDVIVDFSATEYGLQLYFEDGTGYYWER
ncbi:hypothetical protein [Parablautia muri]|uniref:Uncharacterized protein n=1 Tax=Parablautia muri TaxID=2320879 RepID=A0A9X5GUL5_9FIRM|nr:hypothetical protein [Parablautia muri]NBJ95304.1 hypothetical protein [Parablautia muri]